MTSKSVFISYSQGDKELADAVCAKLEAEQINCWIAPRDEHEGKVWMDEVVAGIEQCRILVLIFSSNTEGSGHVVTEVYLATSERMPIVQVRLEDVEPSPSIKYLTITKQWLDAHDKDFDEFMEQLAGAVREHLAELTPELSEEVAPPKPAIAEKSIAVMPFRNDRKDGALEFVADGIANELRSSFAKIPRLRVAPRASTLKYVDGEHDSRELRERLGVRYLISGSVFCDGMNMHVNVDVDDTEESIHVWDRRFEYPMDQMFEAQIEIAAAVAGEFGGVQLRNEIAAAARRPTKSLDAWNLVQSARAFIFGINKKSLDEAERLLRRAVEFDSTYAAAHATLASVLGEKMLHGLSADFDADRNEAKDLADQALLQSPNDPYVLKMCASIRAWVGEHKKSVDLLRYATRLSPFDFGAWGYLGWPLTGSGTSQDLDEVHRIMQRILESAPEHPGACFWHLHRSVAFACQGELEKAAESVRSARELNRALPWAWMHEANVLGHLGETDAATEALDTCLEICPTLTPEHYAQMVRQMSKKNNDAVRARTEGLIAAGLLA